MRIPNFKGVEKLKYWISEAEKREQQLSVPSEMPVENRLKQLALVREKIQVYTEIYDTFQFLALHQEVMLESLKQVCDESMQNNGRLSFKTTTALRKMKQTMNDTYDEYLAEHNA